MHLRFAAFVHARGSSSIARVISDGVLKKDGGRTPPKCIFGGGRHGGGADVFENLPESRYIRLSFIREAISGVFLGRKLAERQRQMVSADCLSRSLLCSGKLYSSMKILPLIILVHSTVKYKTIK